MKVKFSKDETLVDGEILVLVKSKNETKEVTRALNLIADLDVNTTISDKIPLKRGDEVVIVKVADIMFVEVNDEKLTFYTLEKEISVNGHLNKYLKVLDPISFIQISRNSVINVNYLESLEMGFAGSVIAKLTNNKKVPISCRYVRKLYNYLGI